MARRRPSDLKARRELLVARAALERVAIREATQDFQIASERVARVAWLGVSLVRRYCLPLAVLAAGGMFKRLRPLLRAARTAVAVWQTVRLLRTVRH